ncbi:integrating conjugative element protein [Legionella sp. CNM-4043-24]|uniref:integrating conjugative element protein n=1 Tax=Legionella sp. CNM-4043-24 TaxID=3421646 RepID=UPI00403B04E8
MRKLSIVAMLLMIASCYAWQIDTQAPTEESLQLEAKQDVRLPARSKARPGKVDRRKLTLVNFSYSIFIIGDDAVSQAWLKEHARELEKMGALGFVTNISDSAQLETLQDLIKAPLLPANVDDLLAIFGESHYPLIFNEGEIWQ